MSIFNQTSGKFKDFIQISGKFKDFYTSLGNWKYFPKSQGIYVYQNIKWFYLTVKFIQKYKILVYLLNFIIYVKHKIALIFGNCFCTQFPPYVHWNFAIVSEKSGKSAMSFNWEPQSYYIEEFKTISREVEYRANEKNLILPNKIKTRNCFLN